MSQPQVVITDVIETPDVETEILSDVAVVEALAAEHEQDLIGRIETAQAVMAYHTLRFTPTLLERLQKCRLLVRCGVGYDNVDCGHARHCGIPVANVPDYGTEEVADSAFGLILALTRGLHSLSLRLREGRAGWSYTEAGPLRRLRGLRLGIVGLGRIGTALALRARSVGLQILYYDPYKPRGYDKALGVLRCDSLAELLETTSILSLHCPLTKETKGLIDADALRIMPRGSFLVNTARGGIVRSDQLGDLILSGQLAGVALDVLEREPPPQNHPLLRAWRDPKHPASHRLILTPHAAFYCPEGLVEMRQKAARACRAALLGEPIPNLVN